MVDFPLSPRVVRDLFVLSEGVPAFNNASVPPESRARAHTVEKHLQPDSDEFRQRVHDNQESLSAFRDFMEMSQAGEAALNSAWGRFAITQVLRRGVGARAVFETDIPPQHVRVGKPGEVGIELMSRARAVIEAAPPQFGYPFKIQTFFPVPAYRHGRPWCEIVGVNTYFNVTAV